MKSLIVLVFVYVSVLTIGILVDKNYNEKKDFENTDMEFNFPDIISIDAYNIEIKPDKYFKKINFKVDYFIDVKNKNARISSSYMNTKHSKFYLNDKPIELVNLSPYSYYKNFKTPKLSKGKHKLTLKFNKKSSFRKQSDFDIRELAYGFTNTNLIKDIGPIKITIDKSLFKNRVFSNLGKTHKENKKSLIWSFSSVKDLIKILEDNHIELIYFIEKDFLSKNLKEIGILILLVIFALMLLVFHVFFMYTLVYKYSDLKLKNLIAIAVSLFLGKVVMSNTFELLKELNYRYAIYQSSYKTEERLTYFILVLFPLITILFMMIVDSRRIKKEKKISIDKFYETYGKGENQEFDKEL